MIKHIIMIALCIGMTLSTAFFAYTRIHAPFNVNEIVFHIDSFVDRTIKQDIKIYSAHLVKHYQSLSDIAEKIKSKYPFVDVVCVQREPPATMIIDITAHVPIYTINSSLLWTSGNKLVHQKWYKSTAYDSCHNLYVHDETHEYIEDILATVIPKLPRDLIAQYKVIIKDIWSISFNKLEKNKNEENQFSIKCSINTIPHEEMLTYCNKIKHELNERTKPHCKRCQRWIADVRFRDQIIVQADRGM